MAVRKVYTLCALTYWRGRVSDVIVGFTVARSDEEVHDIVREHVPARKTVEVHMANTGGPVRPQEAARTAELLLQYNFSWLDPRGPSHVHNASMVPGIVEQLMTEGHAL